MKRTAIATAGALALAGILQYKLPESARAVAVCSGANMTFERLQQVAERTLIGSGREAMFAVTLPERPGALQEFCKTVVGHHNISEFTYRLNSRKNARILVGVTVSDATDKQALMENMARKGYGHTDLTNDDTVKEHLRHMIGGAPKASNERIYEVIFPERPGALAGFLQAVGNKWNISLFHYRNAASDSGKVLIGFEADDTDALEAKLRAANFAFTTLSHAPGIKLLLR